MSEVAREVVRSIVTEQQLAIFCNRLRNWILTESRDGQEYIQDYPESRARALLRATQMVDDATLSDFARVVATAQGARVALHDLLADSGLAQADEVRALAAVSGRSSGDEAVEINWLSLGLSSHAWKRGYPVVQLDPASPPERFSPAGQVVANTAAFIRQQIQRNATERARVASLLAPRDARSASTLEELREGSVIPPLPPHFRPPIPVRYPEMSRETLHVEAEQTNEQRAVERGESLVITETDIGRDPGEATSGEQAPPVRMPPLRISREQVQPPQPPSPLPPSAVVMPASTTDSRSGLTVSLRQMFGAESLSTTKLRVVVQEHPDGPGLYGLQVKISCKGIKSFVAGTTDRDGRFVAELPVKTQEGLTYDVDLTWPRELGGEVERKSITLHADRTEFTLPFYHRLRTHSEAYDE